MGELKDATDQVRSLAKGYKAFIMLLEAADRMGGIEQGEREAVSRREAMNKEADKADAEAAAAKERMEKAKALARTNEEKAIQILSQATCDAKMILEKAQVKGDILVKQGEAAKAAREQEAEALKQSLAKLESDIASRKTDLATVEKKIAGLKAMASQITGA